MRHLAIFLLMSSCSAHAQISFDQAMKGLEKLVVVTLRDFEGASIGIAPAHGEIAVVINAPDAAVERALRERYPEESRVDGVRIAVALLGGGPAIPLAKADLPPRVSSASPSPAHADRCSGSFTSTDQLDDEPTGIYW